MTKQHLSPHGLALIKRFEGFSATPYTCAAGKPTIGYGHLIRPGERFPPEGIGEALALELLKKDAGAAAAAVRRLAAAPLLQHQFDALVSFTFNIGAGALARSALLRRVNAGDHAAVPGELLRWVYAGGRRLPGLVARRRAEGEVYGGLPTPPPLAGEAGWG